MTSGCRMQVEFRVLLPPVLNVRRTPSSSGSKAAQEGEATDEL